MSKQAVGYVRVSTTIQATEGVSLDAQREAIARWCLANDATLALENLFVEGEAGQGKSRRGRSGKRADNRPALQAALTRVCDLGGVLVFYSLSRLARSVKDTLAIAERLEKAGADMVSLSEQLNTTSASGRMLFRLLAVMAEFERDLVSERTRASLNHKQAKGERMGQLPYGKTLAADGKTLVDAPAEAETIEAIRRMRQVDGLSWRKIADRLTDLGVRTKNGGARWNFGSVRDLIEPKRTRNAKGRKGSGGPSKPPRDQ